MLREDLDLKGRYEGRVKTLKKELDDYDFDIRRDEDDLIWINRKTLDLYEFLLKTKQYLQVVGEEPQNIQKVIKVSTVVDLSYSSFVYPDTSFVLLFGVNILVDTIFIPSKMISTRGGNEIRNWMLTPEKYGLPSGKEVAYGTLKRYSKKYYVALRNTKRNSPILTSVKSPKHYEILNSRELGTSKSF